MPLPIVDPLYLVPDKNVTLTINEGAQYELFAYVAEKEGSFEIVINRWQCKELYDASWISKHITYQEFETGIKLHEVAHIAEETFSIIPEIQNDLYHFISNVLFDNQIEYHMTYKHPSLAPFIRWILIAMKRYTDNKELKKTQQGKNAINHLHTLYYLTRFGVVPKDADEKFVSFMLPLMLSATRGMPSQVHVSSRAIYEYLLAEVTDEDVKEALLNLTDGYGSVTQKDIDKVSSMGQIATSNTLGIVKSSSQQAKGALPGSGKTQLDVDEKDTGFYRKTVQEHWELIYRLRKAFKTRLDRIISTSSYDGDICFKSQQRAYMDSMFSEQSKSYTYFRRMKPSIDIVILRDVSGSTDSYKTLYAQLTVALIASVSELPGIRVSEIDFSEQALVNLNFNEKIKQSRINPRSEGGTRLTPALEEALKLPWRAKKRMLLAITDGGISDTYSYRTVQNELYAQHHATLHLYDISGTPSQDYVVNELTRTTLERFPETLIKDILKRL